MGGSKLNHLVRRATVTCAAVLLLTGCGGTPLSPTSGSVGSDSGFSGRSAPELAGRPPSGGGSSGSGSTGAVALLTAAEVTALLGGTPVLVASASIVGTSGGSVSCGRFSVAVPPGAFRGTGTVTLRMSDPLAMVVDLGITPGNLNDFRKPVALSYDTAGLAGDSLTIYWYNPSTRTWVDMAARPDARTGRTTVYLRHFSIYRAGKAGW
jgi:hypothetical protein